MGTQTSQAGTPSSRPHPSTSLSPRSHSRLSSHKNDPLHLNRLLRPHQSAHAEETDRTGCVARGLDWDQVGDAREAHNYQVCEKLLNPRLCALSVHIFACGSDQLTHASWQRFRALSTHSVELSVLLMHPRSKALAIGRLWRLRTSVHVLSCRTVAFNKA